MNPRLQQGRIVWVELLDPQGRNPKVRPAVVITTTPEIVASGEIVVAAMSSQIDQSRPEVSVELPWDRAGHPKTKLNRRNVVVCDWLVTLPVDAITDDAIGGTVPFAPMARILEIVRSLSGGTSSPPTPQPETDP